MTITQVQLGNTNLTTYFTPSDPLEVAPQANSWTVSGMLQVQNEGESFNRLKSANFDIPLPHGGVQNIEINQLTTNTYAIKRVLHNYSQGILSFTPNALHHDLIDTLLFTISGNTYKYVYTYDQNLRVSGITLYNYSLSQTKPYNYYEYIYTTKNEQPFLAIDVHYALDDSNRILTKIEIQYDKDHTIPHQLNNTYYGTGFMYPLVFNTDEDLPLNNILYTPDWNYLPSNIKVLLDYYQEGENGNYLNYKLTDYTITDQEFSYKLIDHEGGAGAVPLFSNPTLVSFQFN